MIEQLVVLARKSKIATAWMSNDVNHRRWLDHRQSPRDRQRLDARDWILQAQDSGIVAVRRGGPGDSVDAVWPWLVGGRSGGMP